MSKKVAILHTSFVFINVVPIISDLFKEVLPDVEVIDFVDGTVLADVNRAGQVTPSAIKRMTHLAQAAEEAGADIIFSACSSLGPSMDVAREAVGTPIIKIDDAMTQLAVEKVANIGVLATVPTTLPPTTDLIRQKASAMGKQVNIVSKLSEGAFDRLMSGDQAGHDQLVLEAAKSIAPQVDLIVLAQASMTRLAPMLAEATGREVLTSPKLGVKSVKEMLSQLLA